MTESSAASEDGRPVGIAERLRKWGDIARLDLTVHDADRLAEPAAWDGVAADLSRAAGPVSLLQVSVPEGLDRLLDVAVGALAKQGLRFLQLEYEGDGPAFVAAFLPQHEKSSAGRAPFVLRHDLTGQTWDLAPEHELLLGHGEACDVRVASPRASGRHCTIRFARRVFALVDLRSRAGTLLDSRPLQRGVIDEFGRVCLGSKVTGHYTEMELRVPPGETAFLHVISGDHAGRSIPLTRPCLLVGRAPHCDLQIDAPFVSREHLRISLLTDCYLLSDLGSTNGTVQNGRPVLGGRLVPGDRIQVGEEAFTFHSREGLEGFFVPGWRLQSGEHAVPLDRPYTTVGRHPECDFLVGERSISRRHARLVWERPSRLRLYDLASFGGTAVEGNAVAEAELSHGVAIRIGTVAAQVFGVP